MIYQRIANLFKNDSKNRDAISTRIIFQSEYIDKNLSYDMFFFFKPPVKNLRKVA